MQTPTVVLRIADSAIAYEEETGEILETVEFDEAGRPLWEHAGVCDVRGGGGREGYALLAEALEAAERNARLLGFTIVRVPRPGRAA